MMIRLGPAGNIDSDTLSSVVRLKELGITSQEVEFVRQVYLKPAEAKKVGDTAKKLGVSLSVHASYFVNLSSLEKRKVAESKMRILHACKIASFLNAEYVVFHAGYYQGRDKEDVYQLIKKEIISMQGLIHKKGWHVSLAPETTGKSSQFGDIDEILRLSRETGCLFCIDFSHLEARHNKNVDYDALFDRLKGYNHIHAHFSGIEYTDKGERRHLLTPRKKLAELLKAVVKHKVDITIINESPDPLGDTLKGIEMLKG